jgi:hypothetical protein
LSAIPWHKQPKVMKLRNRILIHAGLACVLLLVFALYLRPDFLVTLADQVWACF